MGKDERYKAAKRVIENDDVQDLKQIFKFIPKTVMARDLGINPVRFGEKLKHVERFRLEELFGIAELLGVDDLKILWLASRCT